jgi:hypothetical protein
MRHAPLVMDLVESAELFSSGKPQHCSGENDRLISSQDSSVGTIRNVSSMSPHATSPYDVDIVRSGWTTC